MVLTLDRWVKKVAVVTGASSGIGAALAQRLVKEGITVAALARRVELVEQLSNALKNEKGRLIAIKCDVSNEEDIKNSFKFITENLGPVHILVNNAGISIQKRFPEASIDDLRKVLDTNVLAVAIFSKLTVENMRENNVAGHIININSIYGQHFLPHMFMINLYPASKHAVKALSETFRQEFNEAEQKIKITNVSPGIVATEMTTFVKDMPKLQCEDIVDGIVYVLSTPEHVQVQELTIKPIGERL